MARVLTMGTFDLMHVGHIYLFQQCRKIAGDSGTVVVGLNPDEFIQEFKKRLPAQSYDERFFLVSSVKYIDEIYPTPGQDAKPLIDSVAPDFIVIGSDWAGVKEDGTTYYTQLQITQDYLQEKNIGLLYLDRLGKSSTTELKERIRGTIN